VGAAADFVERRFGCKTRSYENPVTSSPGAGITRILDNNPDRLMYTVVNLDTAAMFLAWTPDPSDEKGVYLDALGGSVTICVEDDGELVTYEVYIFSLAGGNIFTVVTKGG